MPSTYDVRYEVPTYPRQVRLDSTCFCNAKCPSCHRGDRRGEMPMSLLREIVNDISKWGNPLMEIVPVNYGEFFIRKDWYEILEEINMKLPYTNIVIPTNGSLLTPEMVGKLCRIPSVRIINFSVNAYFDESYRDFMGLDPSVIDNIRRYISNIKIIRPDILCRVSMVSDPEYQTDLEHDLFVQHWIGHAEPWLLQAASAGRPSKVPFKQLILPCRSIYFDIVIGCDRKISSCCFDADFSIDLGSYTGDVLANWKGKELTELRKTHDEHRRGEIDICSRCTFA